MNDDMELVTSVEIRRWAEGKRLIPVGQPGRVSNQIIDAYESAHPDRLYSRYAHGPGGYDKGCRCQECKIAHGLGPKCCAMCTRYKASVTTAKAEVVRLARAMARSARNEERMAPVLAKAKAELEKVKHWQAEHQREHDRDDVA